MSPPTETYRALVLTDPSTPFTIEESPIPKPTPGTALLRVLAAPVLSYASQIFKQCNPRNDSFPVPMSRPGNGAHHGRYRGRCGRAARARAGGCVL